MNSSPKAYFEEFDKSYFLNGIKILEYRWAKCIKLKGDYDEKLKKKLKKMRFFL